MGLDRGIIREVKKCLTEDRYKKLKNLDEDLQNEIARCIVLALRTNRNIDTNKLFDIIFSIVETFNKVIELEYKKIEKLERLRKGILQELAKHPEKATLLERGVQYA